MLVTRSSTYVVVDIAKDLHKVGTELDKVSKPVRPTLHSYIAEKDKLAKLMPEFEHAYADEDALADFLEQKIMPIRGALIELRKTAIEAKANIHSVLLAISKIKNDLETLKLIPEAELRLMNKQKYDEQEWLKIVEIEMDKITDEYAKAAYLSTKERTNVQHERATTVYTTASGLVDLTSTTIQEIKAASTRAMQKLDAKLVQASSTVSPPKTMPLASLNLNTIQPAPTAGTGPQFFPQAQQSKKPLSPPSPQKTSDPVVSRFNAAG